MAKVSEPDCYETPDAPVTTGVLKDARQPDAPQSSDIDDSSHMSSEVFKKFSGKLLDTSKQNYDRVNIAQPLNQSEYSYNPSARNSESALERYHRLRAEIESLASDLKTVEQEYPKLELEQGNKAADIAKQLQSLKNVLDQCESAIHHTGTSGTVQCSNIVNQLTQELQSSSQQSDTDNNRITYELYCTPDVSKQEQNRLFAEIEKRVAAIESGIGSTKEIQKPLADTLEILEEKLSLLDETKLSIVETKIASLADKLGDNSTEAFETNDKIESLFAMMKQWDNTSQQVPIVVDRLVSLKAIHERGISAANTIHQLQRDQSEVTDLLKSTAASFQQLESAFEENKKIISSNVAALEARMSALEAKLGQ